MGIKYYLNASELAAASGFNRYKSREDLLEIIQARKAKKPIDPIMDIVTLLGPETLKKLNELIPKAETESESDDESADPDYESSESERESSSDDESEDLDPEEIVSRIHEAIYKDAVTISKDNKVTGDLQKKLERAANEEFEGLQELIELKETIAQETRMEVGTISERQDLDKNEEKLGKKIREDTSMKYAVFELPSSGRKVKMGGRVDGMDEDGNVIETKHRRNRIFGFVPKYERIQCECYMRITGTEVMTHIENYDGESRITELTRDDELWDTVLEELEEFCDMIDTIGQ